MKILALGDSWFHYPTHLGNNGEFPKPQGVGNIIYFLFKNHNLNIFYDETSTGDLFDASTHNVKSKDDALGCCGEELLVMVRDDQPSWLDLLRTRIQKYASETDEFVILLSAGGNDIADTHLAAFINADTPESPADDPLTLINMAALDLKINKELKDAFLKLIDHICVENPTKNFHFIVHGYSYPPINGRGVLDQNNNVLHDVIIKLLQKQFPGPWLMPTFILKNIISFDRKTGRSRSEIIMNHFIDLFNDMLQTLNCRFPNGDIHYIDLRNIPGAPNEDDCWCNELHFNRDNFTKAADKFAEVLNGIDPGLFL